MADTEQLEQLQEKAVVKDGRAYIEGVLIPEVRVESTEFFSVKTGDPS